MSTQISSKAFFSETPKSVLVIPDLRYDIDVAKTNVLFKWVEVFIVAAPGTFISTNDLYSYYVCDLSPLNPAAIMIETTFYKEIQSVLLANNLIFGKTRQYGKRGFNGIDYLKNIKKGLMHFFLLRFFAPKMRCKTLCQKKLCNRSLLNKVFFYCKKPLFCFKRENYKKTSCK